MSWNAYGFIVVFGLIALLIKVRRARREREIQYMLSRYRMGSRFIPVCPHGIVQTGFCVACMEER